MEIIVIPKINMKLILATNRSVVNECNIISIIDPGEKFLFDEPTPPNVLQLKFNDLEADEYKTDKELAKVEEMGWILFNEGHAQSIINFLNGINTDKDLIVHCTAGISRSGAIGDFARVKFGIPFGEFILKNPQIQPNSWIRRTLLALEYP